MAPEIHLPENGCSRTPSLASDIWAFGMTMLEVLTGELPYSKAPTEAIVITVITRDHKIPERPGSHVTELGLSDDVWALMKECWDIQHPEKRPNTEQLTRSLEKLSENTPITAWKDRTVRLSRSSRSCRSNIASRKPYLSRMHLFKKSLILTMQVGGNWMLK